MTDVFSKVHFNTSDFKFKEIILDSLKQIPELKHVVDIEDIGEAVDPSLKPLMEQHIYARFSSLDFREAYKNFCLSHLTAFFPQPFQVQKVPSVRLSFPGARSVNFHNDCWYGHGTNVHNFWLPLTAVKSSQALAFLSPKDNERALKKFYEEEPSLSNIQAYCAARANYVEMDYGEFLYFPTKSLHGTTTNQSGRLRISFDFRVLTDDDRGKKTKDFFVFPEALAEAPERQSISIKRPALGYSSQKMRSDLQISQTIQQQANAEYASRNDLYLVAQETELIGFNRLLNFEDMISGERQLKARDIVVFSEACMPPNSNERDRLFDIATSNGFTIHFVNEGHTYSKR